MPLDEGYISNLAARNKKGDLVVPCVLIRKVFTDVAAKVTNGVSASHVGAAAAGTRNMTLGGSLASGGVATFATPRNVVITVTHGSAVVAMSGTITGTDEFGDGLTEAWSVTAGTTSKTFTGKKAFKTITSITETVAADASANTIIAGSGDVLGLTTICLVASAVKELSGGSVVTNGTVTAGGTGSTVDPRGTYAPNTVPDGSVDYEVYYIASDLIAKRAY